MTTILKIKEKSFKYNLHRHPFHLVDPSPWPLLTALHASLLTVSIAGYFHSFVNGGLLLLLSLSTLILCMGFWWDDVVTEATYEGHHTSYVQKGLKMGMILFIVSEIMFFFAFFWAFFHSSLNPAVEIGCIWPPEGIHSFNPWDIPLVNTLILLLSGATVTYCHQAIILGWRFEAVASLGVTIFLGLFFTAIQGLEYVTGPFNISDSVYGSVFYMLTGFHGIHVLIGTLFLIVGLVRLIHYHFNSDHHFGFEAAAWYWHFVDVVWIFLFIVLYWWGGN